MTKMADKQEQQFLGYTKKLDERTSTNIVIIRYGLSRLLDQTHLISDMNAMEAYLESQRARAKKIHDAVQGEMKNFEGAVVYLFVDNDIIVTFRFKEEAELQAFKASYEKISHCLPSGASEFLLVKDNLSYCKRIAQERCAHVDLINTYYEMAMAARSQMLQAVRTKRHKPLVMIADSSPQSADFIKRLLAENYETLIVKSGPTAISEYIRQAPDCVVLDLNPPELSGMEVSVCIKALDIQAFIVMMSNDAVQQKIVDAFNSGAGDFIKKPFPRARLLKAINKSPYIGGDKPGSLQEMQAAEEIFLF